MINLETTLSNKEASLIVSNFNGIKSTIEEDIEPFSRGWNNKYKIIIEGEKYLLSEIPSERSDRLKSFTELYNAAKEAGICVPEYLELKDKRIFFEYKGNFYSLKKFFENKNSDIIAFDINELWHRYKETDLFEFFNDFEEESRLRTFRKKTGIFEDSKYENMFYSTYFDAFVKKTLGVNEIEIDNKVFDNYINYNFSEIGCGLGVIIAKLLLSQKSQTINERVRKEMIEHANEYITHMTGNERYKKIYSSELVDTYANFFIEEFKRKLSKNSSSLWNILNKNSMNILDFTLENFIIVGDKKDKKAKVMLVDFDSGNKINSVFDLLISSQFFPLEYEITPKNSNLTKDAAYLNNCIIKGFINYLCNKSEWQLSYELFTKSINETEDKFEEVYYPKSFLSNKSEWVLRFRNYIYELVKKKNKNENISIKEILFPLKSDTSITLDDVKVKYGLNAEYSSAQGLDIITTPDDKLFFYDGKFFISEKMIAENSIEPFFKLVTNLGRDLEKETKPYYDGSYFEDLKIKEIHNFLVEYDVFS
ncbi:Uncharacterised protein [Candidatus Tiddalikarchaeum anstoanum]|nr:Uncharacterised protein [Candidatus Tiddalikarchaeum anstoanum]